MSCRETRPLLPLFVDGELNARQMRSVALHSTRCEPCEKELRQIEKLQDLLSEHVRAVADEVDVNQIWAGVSARIGARSSSWAVRLREWWEEVELGSVLRVPAYAAAAAALVLAVQLWWPGRNAENMQLADNGIAVDNSARLDSVNVDKEIDSFALLNEPETNTMVLWVSDDSGAAPAAGDPSWGGLP